MTAAMVDYEALRAREFGRLDRDGDPGRGPVVLRREPRGVCRDLIAPGPLADQWFVDGAGNRTNYTTTFFGPALFSARREVHTSAGDLAAFAKQLFGGGLLSPATKAVMLTIVPDDGSIAGQTGGGLRIRRSDYLGRTLYGHRGATIP